MSKLNLKLDRSMTAQEAAGIIFGHLLNAIERNEQGIREDVDIEFVHDFRVAIRRTRSGLSQIKGVLPTDIARGFRERFAELGRSTNRLRDLDVYLLNRGRYRDMLLEDLRPALDPLFEELSEEREEQLASVVRLLDSDDYRALLLDWRRTLEAFGTSSLQGTKSSVPVGDLSRRFISRWYTRVNNRGSRIDDTAPDAALHALRIDCKKLRYLLEFFASLYPPQDIFTFVTQLKRLQDNLGEFNDLSVQQVELQSFLQKSRTPVSADTAAAVELLTARLEDRQRDVRGHFSVAFETFTGPENNTRFQRLFGKA